MRWVTVFTHAGLRVKVQDPDPNSWHRYQTMQAQLLEELQRLHPSKVSPEPVQFTTSITQAVEAADFIQENAPENLSLKRALIRELDAAAPDHAIIASSSSALRVSDFQSDCLRPERIVLGHPFNPVHLMPLVEVVGGNQTSAETVSTAAAFYEAIGKKPVVLRKELTGHLALRLMGAMWREAIALVNEGAVSVQDIDRAFIYGPGPKWTLQGAFISNHLGADGISDFLNKYGKTYEDIWHDLRDTPDLMNTGTQAAIINGTQAAIGERSNNELQDLRDAGLVEILTTQQKYGV